MTRSPTAPIDQTDGVAEIADAIARGGRFAIDLEFVSEDRYIPELALVQVAWGEPGAPEVAAVDPLAVDPAPLFALVADPDVEVVAHAARQDLGLLVTSYGVTARGFVDTQIAASFAGLPDQIGYGRMVQQLFGVALDKGSQHTDWRRRPLSERQLRYALDDVRHLLGAWEALRARLEARGRLPWAREESLRLAESVAQRRPPDEIYRQIGGWVALKGPALSALRELAAWREREALSSNTPPSWILPEAALVEVARRMPRSAAELTRVRGVTPTAARRHGDAILAALTAAGGRAVAIEAARPLGARAQAQAAIVAAIVQSRCGEADVPARLVGGRSEAEALVAWFETGGAEGSVPAPLLLEGWRHEVAGSHAIAWLRGETALAADARAPGGVRTIEVEGRGAARGGAGDGGVTPTRT